MPEPVANKLVEKLQRLRAMEPRELAHRSRERVYAELDRIRAGMGIRSSRPAPADFKSYLSGAPASRFYCSQRQDLQPFVRKNFPEWIEKAVDEAERLCRHEVTLLGYEQVELGPEIDWHRDPVTGRTWERRFWADYRLVDDHDGRDAKIIHELNRHQHLPRLAKAYRLTGDERYASEAVAQLISWIDQNPRGRGINWQSSLEIGIRAISWMWTIFPLLPSSSFDPASAQKIGDSLFQQLEHAHRYLSVYSSPNTHLIGESAALFIAGLVFQDQPRGAQWLRRGAALLTETAGKQVLDDGVYGELSTYYHCYALDFYLQCLVLGEQNGFCFPELVPEKARDMVQFLLHVTRPDGTLPMLGDDDGGRALAIDRRDYRSYRDGLCLGAILFRRGDLKHQAGAFCEEALWMLGQDAWESYRQFEGHEPADLQAPYASAGYSVQRSGWGPDASHLVFDSGGLGMLTGGHAHADALSVTLFREGRELLVDPGTYIYNCAPEWRQYFRSTRGHNTVTIDGLDQAEQAGTFRWKTKLSHPSVPKPGIGPAVRYLEGQHDGYLRLPQGIVHRRRVLWPSPECWILVDDFFGSGEHTFDFHYHFAPGVDVAVPNRTESGIAAQVDGGSLRLSLCGTGVSACGSEVIAGWASSKYGSKQACSILRASIQGSAPVAAMTFLAPATARIARLPLQSGSGLACACHLHQFTDYVVLSTANTEISVAGFRMRGEFFWLRMEGDVLKQVLAIRACSLDRGDSNIFRRSEPGTYSVAIHAGSDVKKLCAEFAAS